MHFEFLVEDQSGRIALEAYVESILGRQGEPHTFRFHNYKGVGCIPPGLRSALDPKKRVLLDRLPRLLAGYGKSLQQMDAAVVVVIDLDQRNCLQFKQELLDILASCEQAPTAIFRFAIEEMEAWLLGDTNAVISAFPKAKRDILDRYDQDSICGTWEILADAIYPGGSRALKKRGYPLIGQVKSEWALEIGCRVDVDSNQSKSFQVFRDSLRRLVHVDNR